ncbi:hypothetical protein [Microviridae sp.]|nr:hypothetical protein [Microviridae sp.]
MTKQKKQIQRFQTPFTITSVTGTLFTEPSQTVQGDSYTVQELIEKHVQGIAPSVGLNPEYDHEEPSFEDDVTLRKPDLDLTDIDQMSEKVKTTLEKVEKQKRRKAAENDRSSVAKDEAKTVSSVVEDPLAKS